MVAWVSGNTRSRMWLQGTSGKIQTSPAVRVSPSHFQTTTKGGDTYLSSSSDILPPRNRAKRFDLSRLATFGKCLQAGGF
jgi:hypothetical protein